VDADVPHVGAAAPAAVITASIGSIQYNTMLFLR